MNSRKLKLNNTAILFFFGLVSFTFAVTESANAQRPFKKMRERFRENFPKGELLKKLRDEISGANKEKDKKKADDKKKVGPAKEGPQPTPAAPQNQNRQKPFRLSDPSDSELDPMLTGNSPTGEFITTDAKKFKKEYRNKGLVIRSTPKKGILADAGIQRGDRIVGIGGLPVNVEKDISAVVDLLKKGDQVEIVLVRGGKFGSLLAANGQIDANDERLSTAPGNPSDNSLVPGRRRKLSETPNFELPRGNDPLDPRNSVRGQSSNRDVEPKPSTIQNDYFRSVMELPGENSKRSQRPSTTKQTDVPKTSSRTNSSRTTQRAKSQDEQILQLQREIERLKRDLRKKAEDKSAPLPKSDPPSVKEVPSVFDLLDENKSKNK